MHSTTKLLDMARAQLDLVKADGATALAVTLHDVASYYGESCFEYRQLSRPGRTALIALGRTYGIEEPIALQAVVSGVETGWQREERRQLIRRLEESIGIVPAPRSKF